MKKKSEEDNDNNVVEVIKEERVGYSVSGTATPLTDVYVKIKAAFREKALKLLKGPKLSCFLCVALHVDDKGESYPSIDTIMRQTGYSRPAVCSALAELEKLGFIEKKRRKHQSALYKVKGYIWYGSDSSPTLLGEAESKLDLLSDSQSKAGKRLPTKRLPSEPKDKPSSKDKPLSKESSSAPSADKKPNGLLPDTQFSRMMFGRLQASARAQGRRGPSKFKTLEQKQKFDEAAAKLTDKEFEKALVVGLEQGINSIDRMTNWIAKWDSNGQKSPRPVLDPGRFDEATRMTRERLKHGNG